MKRFDLAGGVAGLMLAFSAGWAAGQVAAQAPVVAHPAGTSALPATPSTSAAAVPATPAMSKPLTPDQLPPHRALVVYANGRLSVEANNSSLNQILWAIGRKMGMTITGGVQDERVYGSYGPDDPAAVLSALIDGTNSNMLLKTGAPGGSELVLTTRGGGPTPPSPGPGPDVADDPREDLPPQKTRPRPAAASAPAAATPTGPVTPATQAGVAPAATTPAATATVTPAATGAAATTTQASPNGVKTPDQIFQQLLKLQQAQAKTASPAAAPATTPATPPEP